jgi:hypothetical protein
MSTRKEDLTLSNVSDSPEIAAYEALVQGLLDERKAILARFKSQVNDLEGDKNLKLELNRQRLLRIGYDQSKIPMQLGVGRKFLKLDDSRLKEVLSEFMDSGQWYPSTPLLQHLKISYPDFRDFVKKNPDFIEKDGDNRGRLYKLKNRS